MSDTDLGKDGLMNMNSACRKWLKAGTVAAVVAGLLPVSAAAITARPNILYVMTDQQPKSTIGAYGNPLVRTPNLDRLAALGIKFQDYYIAGFPCCPSRASMLTGRYVHSHGVVQNEVPLDPAIPALGDVFKAAGYRTGYIGKWHLSGQMYRGVSRQKGKAADSFLRRVADDQQWRFERAPGATGEDEPAHGFTDRWVGGWEHYRNYLRRVGLGEFVDKHPRVGNHNDAPSGPDSTHAYSLLPAEHHVESFLTGEAVRFLEEQKGRPEPFCLVLSLYGPHLPVAPPQPWDSMFPADKVPLPKNFRDDLIAKPERQHNTRTYVLPRWTEGQFKDYVGRYWGYCAFIDNLLGSVFQKLEESDLTENTIVVFTSDHGDMIGSHGSIWKLTGCGYEELYNVPFIISWPSRWKGGRTVDELASSVDVFPTLLELAGVAPPAGVQGKSFAGLLDGKTRKHRDTIYSDSMGRSFILRSGQWKYCAHWSPRDVEELYDLKADPGELENLATKRARKLKQMRGKLFAWLEETGHPYGAVIKNVMSTPRP